jgi:hypothetical protein
MTYGVRSSEKLGAVLIAKVLRGAKPAARRMPDEICATH